MSKIDKTDIENIKFIAKEAKLSSLTRIKIKKGGSVLEGDAYFPQSKTFNPAFDVTPSKLVSKIITEFGTIDCNRKSIEKLMTK